MESFIILLHGGEVSAIEGSGGGVTLFFAEIYERGTVEFLCDAREL
jgi:hypothetical protein